MKKEYNAQWGYFADSNTKINPRLSVVGPLLKRDGHEIAWGLKGNNEYIPDTSKIYNKYCPPSSGCAHTQTGCVATALGQIMWYWQWPYAPKTTHNFNRLVNTYDWTLMPYQLMNNSSLEEVNMVAKLLHEIGVAINMSYGCGGSSSFLEDAVTGLRNTYYFHSDDKKNRFNFADSTWFELIKGELNESRPVLYAGSSPYLGSHAFVIDGYNSNNQYHLNLGFNGNSNGFYNLNDVYQNGQAMLTNISPNYEFYCDTFLVPYTDDWPMNFTVQHGGGITIEQMTFTNGMHGNIYSEEYVKFNEGIYIEEGAEIYVDIRGSRCQSNQYEAPLLIMHPDSYEYNSGATQDLDSFLFINTIATKILRDGQILIKKGNNTYTITGQKIK